MFLKSTALALALAMASGPAAAQMSQRVTKTVQVGGLDLETQTGAVLLLNRIEFAAGQVCGERPDIRWFEVFEMWQGCMDDATRTAVAAVGAPMVAQLYEDRIRVASR